MLAVSFLNTISTITQYLNDIYILYTTISPGVMKNYTDIIIYIGKKVLLGNIKMN